MHLFPFLVCESELSWAGLPGSLRMPNQPVVSFTLFGTATWHSLREARFAYLSLWSWRLGFTALRGILSSHFPNPFQVLLLTAKAL